MSYLIAKTRMGALLCFLALHCICITPAFAQLPETCAQNFYALQPPVMTGKKAHNNKVIISCLNGFATAFSTQYKAPLWSSEHITKQKLQTASTLTRTDYFHEAWQLPFAFRTKLKDVKVQGYDRGHLAPHYNMSTREAQFDSFNLSNIVLQHSKHNRTVWADVERLSRYLAYKYNEVYSVTGAHYHEQKKQQTQVKKETQPQNQLPNQQHNQPKKISTTGVAIPAFLYKAIYIPSIQKAGVYWSPNNGSQKLSVLSLRDFQKITGITLWPSLPQHIQKPNTHSSILPTQITQHSSLSDKHPQCPQKNSPHLAGMESSHNKNDCQTSIENFIVSLQKIMYSLFY